MAAKRFGRIKEGEQAVKEGKALGWGNVEKERRRDRLSGNAGSDRKLRESH